MHDIEIYQEYHVKKSKGGLVGAICSYAALLVLLGLFTTGLVYKISGENFTINNQTVLVIKTGSMSGFYDNKIAETYNYDTSLQFGVGDLCVFEKVDDNTELVKGEVYGYKQKGIIITHRLVEQQLGGYVFRGDNNPVSDGYLIARENIVYHYIGRKVPGIGAFILYAQSFFGIWSLAGIIGITISSEVIYYKINKINKEREVLMNEAEDSSSCD